MLFVAIAVRGKRHVLRYVADERAFKVLSWRQRFSVIARDNYDDAVTRKPASQPYQR